jgi:glycosyltransferase involved in cell wall biosynthesis
MENQPLVSIIIPTYNRAHLIGETLDSVLAQTYQNWECIIVDDGSTDNTDEVVSKYVQNDSRFKYYHRPKEYWPGGNDARNYGFEVSKGKYVNWFDSDDLMLPEKIEKQIQVIKDTNLDMITCYALGFYDDIKKNSYFEYFNPKKINSKTPSYDLLNGNLNFSTPGPLWRRGFLTNKELFDERLKKSQEADFNFRISINGLKFKYIEKPLYIIRRNRNENKIKRKKLDNDLNFIISIFYYFKNTFITSKKIDQSNVHYIYRKKMMNYAFYRMMFQYTKIRLIDLSQSNSYLRYIFKSLIQTPLNFFTKYRIFIGLLIFHFTKKGYKLMHVKALSLK